MFPFNYIPETINPSMRKLIIWLISIQFIAFVILMITLIYEFCKRKNNKDKVEEAKDINEKNKF